MDGGAFRSVKGACESMGVTSWLSGSGIAAPQSQSFDSRGFNTAAAAGDLGRIR